MLKKLSKYNLLVSKSDGEEIILFNTFNGSCLKIKKEVAHALENKDISLLKCDDIKLFQKTGVLIQNNIGE